MCSDLRKAFALMRDRNVLYCAICGCLIEKKDKITLDHHVPKSKGGASDASNLLPAHKICNEIKSDIMPDVFEKTKIRRFEYALNNYKLKHRDRQIIKEFLYRQKRSR